MFGTRAETVKRSRLRAQCKGVGVRGNARRDLSLKAYEKKHLLP